MRIGIFGGTFNPIHFGHIELAKSVLDSFELDKLIFVPAKYPPHKNYDIVDSQQRFEMVSLAVASLGERVSVSNFELEVEGISYTYNTLLHFRKIYSSAEIYFLVGTDIFSTIETWNNWEKLFNLASFIVINRPGKDFGEMLEEIPKTLYPLISEDRFTLKKYGQIILYKIDPVDISSSEIRNNNNNNEKKSSLPKEVYNYIQKNNLYKQENK